GAGLLPDRRPGPRRGRHPHLRARRGGAPGGQPVRRARRRRQPADDRPGRHAPAAHGDRRSAAHPDVHQLPRPGHVRLRRRDDLHEREPVVAGAARVRLEPRRPRARGREHVDRDGRAGRPPSRRDPSAVDRPHRPAADDARADRPAGRLRPRRPGDHPGADEGGPAGRSAHAHGPGRAARRGPQADRRAVWRRRPQRHRRLDDGDRGLGRGLRPHRDSHRRPDRAPKRAGRRDRAGARRRHVRRRPGRRSPGPGVDRPGRGDHPRLPPAGAVAVQVPGTASRGARHLALAVRSQRVLPAMRPAPVVVVLSAVAAVMAASAAYHLALALGLTAYSARSDPPSGNGLVLAGLGAVWLAAGVLVGAGAWDARIGGWPAIAGLTALAVTMVVARYYSPDAYCAPVAAAVMVLCAATLADEGYGNQPIGVRPRTESQRNCNGRRSGSDPGCQPGIAPSPAKASRASSSVVSACGSTWSDVTSWSSGTGLPSLSTIPISAPNARLNPPASSAATAAATALSSSFRRPSRASSSWNWPLPRMRTIMTSAPPRELPR